MDWLRRNWPDLIIGVALIAVIAGIVATLLSGGSFLSFGGPRLGSEDAGAQPPAVQGSPNAEPGTGQDAGQPESQANAPASSADDAQQGSGVEPVAPDLQGGNAGTDDAQAVEGAREDTPADTPEAAGVDAVAPSEADAPPGAEQDTAAQTPGDADQGDATIEGTSYRISVGAFTSRESALSVTERYSAEGLPTLIASQGDLSLALVGPYASEEEANRVAQQIIEDGGEALVYAYESESSASESESASQNGSDFAEDDAENTEGDVVAGAVTDTPATDSAEGAPQSGTFLQAGAFGSSESAQFRREQIEELGYATSERETGAGLVRLFVGPLGPSEIEEAQTQLGTLGIDSFPVSIP